MSNNEWVAETGCNGARPKIVLNVEEDYCASKLLKIAFRECGLPCEMHRVGEGKSALNFLRNTGFLENRPKPNLVLLNLNLRGMDGLQVLEEMQRDPGLRDIPVVIFSLTGRESDRARCLALGARHFIPIPMHFDDLLDAVQTAYSCASA